MPKLAKQTQIALLTQQNNTLRQRLGLTPYDKINDSVTDDVHMINTKTQRSGTKGAQNRALVRLQREQHQLKELSEKLKKDQQIEKTKQLKDKKIKELQEQPEKIQEQLEELGVLTNENELRIAKQDIAQLDEKIVIAQQELDATKKQQLTIQEKSDLTLINDNKVINALLEELEQTQVLQKEYQNELAHFTHKNTILRNKKKQFVIHMEGLSNKTQQLEAQKAELIEQKQQQQNINRHLTTLIEAFQQGIADLEREFSITYDTNQMLIQNNDMLNEKLTNIDKEKESAERAHAEALNENQHLIQRIGEMTDLNTALQMQLEESTHNIEHKQQQNNVLTAQNAAQQQQITAQQQEIAALRALLASKQQEIDHAKHMGMESQTVLSTVLNEQDKLQTSHDDLTRQLEKSNNDNKLLTDTVCKEQLNNFHLTRKINDQTQLIANIENELVDIAISQSSNDDRNSNKILAEKGSFFASSVAKKQPMQNNANSNTIPSEVPESRPTKQRRV